MIYFLLILAAFVIAGYLILRDKTQKPTKNGGSGGGSEYSKNNDILMPNNNEQTL